MHLRGLEPIEEKIENERFQRDDVELFVDS